MAREQIRRLGVDEALRDREGGRYLVWGIIKLTRRRFPSLKKVNPIIPVACSRGVLPSLIARCL
jgi:hypothetical protein